MRCTQIAVRVLTVCALAGSVGCATEYEPTGVEYSARLALAKPPGTVQFGTSGDDVANAIAAGKLGVAVVGTTAGALDGQTNAGGRDAFVQLFDKRGAVVWTKQFGTGADDGAWGVAMDRNGIFVAGSTSGTLAANNLGASDGYIQMLDANGSLVWSTRLASAGADSAFGVTVDRDAVYVTGELRGVLEGTTVGDADGYVVKLNARTGEIVWMTRFIGTSGGDDGARAVTVAGSAVYVAATYDGGASGNGPGAEDAYLVKLDGNTGAITWHSAAATAGKDIGVDVTSIDGSVFLVGTSGEHSFASSYAGLTGALQWSTIIATAGSDVATTADAGQNTLHVGGFTTGAFAGASNAGLNDAFHATLDATTGAIHTIEQFGTTGTDALFGSILDGKAWHVVGTTAGDLAGPTLGALDGWWMQRNAP